MMKPGNGSHADGQGASGRYRFDGIEVDAAAHTVVRDGHPRALEPKAFGVLALLAGTPGRVFARDEILDAVWGHRHVTQSVLNRIMSLLRQALGEDAQHPRMLHTVYGVGYRFDLPAPAPTAGAAVPDVAAAGLLPPRRRKAWPVAAAIAPDSPCGSARKTTSACASTSTSVATNARSASGVSCGCRSVTRFPSLEPAASGPTSKDGWPSSSRTSSPPAYPEAPATAAT